MKSQDIVLLLKLVSQERNYLAHTSPHGGMRLWQSKEWRGWLDPADDPNIWGRDPKEGYSVRALEASTGISKTEISASLRRVLNVGLAKVDRKSGNPKANTASLLEFVIYGLKYVFPARPGTLGRGIPTAASAPALAEVLFSPGGHSMVWEDANGTTMGQLIEPLYKTVPHAVRRDPDLYTMLALVDSIRVGRERETALAKKLLKEQFDWSSYV